MNLGNPREITVRELAQTIIRLTGSHSRLEFLPLPKDDPKQRCPDISLAREALGWEPRVAVEEGLRSAIQYFDRLLAGHDDAPLARAA